MDYQSNLHAPDLRGNFPHLHGRVMGHSFGHTVYSDWADKSENDPVFGIFKQCGLWTRDEAAILYHVAQHFHGNWLDIGSHTGWTAAHILAAGASEVWGVDPMYNSVQFLGRAAAQAHLIPCPFTSAGFFESFRWKCEIRQPFIGAVIDGSHEDNEPIRDAVGVVKLLEPGGVILFHDFVGQSVREAVALLIDKYGFMCRLYLTPHVVAVCWRGQSADDPTEFHPPIHVPEPGLIKQNLFERWPERRWLQYA